MGQLSRLLRNVQGGRLAFHCPGCGMTHCIPVQIREQRLAIPDPEDPDWTPPIEYYEALGGTWSWNGDPVRPSFQPSILVSYPRGDPPVTAENIKQWRAAPWPQTTVTDICHSFVTDGRIQFLGDCTHALAGQTVDMVPWPQPPNDQPETHL